MKKKLVSMILALAMIISVMFPAAVFSEGENEGAIPPEEGLVLNSSSGEDTSDQQAAEPPAAAPAEEEPAEEAPADEPAADEPADEAPADEPAADEPAEENPADEPAADEPAEENPADEPAADEPAEEKPADEPAADEPAEENPVDEPAADKPADETTESEAEPDGQDTEPVLPDEAVDETGNDVIDTTRPASESPAFTGGYAEVIGTAKVYDKLADGEEIGTVSGVVRISGRVNAGLENDMLVLAFTVDNETVDGYINAAAARPMSDEEITAYLRQLAQEAQKDTEDEAEELPTEEAQAEESNETVETSGDDAQTEDEPLTEEAIPEEELEAVTMDDAAQAAVIVTPPENCEVDLGETATFTVVAEHAAGYQWQWSNNNSTWKNASGMTSSTYTLTAVESKFALYFRVEVTGEDGGKVYSDSVRCVRKPGTEAAVIVTAPTDCEVEVGGTATFTVAAEHATGYQWQWSNNNSTWKNASGMTSSTYTLTAIESKFALYFRVEVTGEDGGKVYSDSVRCVKKAGTEAAVIVTAPTDCEVEVGGTATFTVTASHAIGYQWQWSNNNSTWKNASGMTNSTYTLTAIESKFALYFRVEVTGENGAKVYSDSVRCVKKADTGAAVIVTAPTDCEVELGGTATFTVVAEHAAGYQWQWSNNNSTWKNATGMTGSTYTLTAIESKFALYFRVEVTGGDGGKVYSDSVRCVKKAGTEAAVIVTAPTNCEVEVGGTATFTVVAEHATGYQWQWSNNNSTWKNASGMTKSTYTLTAAESKFLLYFRVEVTGEDGGKVYSDSVRCVHNDGAPATITTAPTDCEVELNGTATFTVEAENAAAYQWQWSNNGTTWKNATGKTESTYTLTAVESKFALYFRVLVTGTDGSEVASDAVRCVIPVRFTVNEVTYYILEDRACVMIESYAGTAAALVIPEEPRTGYTVTQVGPSAFEGNQTLTSIDLPDTITLICTRAFANCTNLSSMN